MKHNQKTKFKIIEYFYKNQIMIAKMYNYIININNY